MTDGTRSLDPVLRPFAEAIDDHQAERELTTVIEERAFPLAQAIVRRKMRPYAASASPRSGARDLDDLVGDAMVSLVERLRRIRLDAGEPPIENLDKYTAAVVHSVCAHDVRSRYPERARLKSRLRYVFATDRRLALWASEDDELVCGVAAWKGQQASLAAARNATQLIARLDSPWSELRPLELATAAAELMTTAGGPIDLETLVSLGATGIEEPREAPDAVESIPTPATQETAIDQQRFLALVWREIGELPVRQRVALLLNLRDQSGRGVLWLLPVAGIATIRDIARGLDRSDEELARLWPDLPLDDSAIATLIGCTRQQVINLRMAARKRLTNRIARRPAGSVGRSKANLTALSSSLKGSA